MADTNQQQTWSGINDESERKTEKGKRGKVACSLYLCSTQYKCILILTVLFMASFFILDCEYASAEGQTKSVQGRRIERIQRLLSGEKVAPGEEEWQKICKRYENVTIPSADKPTAEVASILGKCSSYELYYGFNQPVDPAKATLCAYAEIDNRVGDGPFSGTDMLMTIYANGIGAKRNLPLAIKLACRIEGAPAEMEERIAHLDRLRKTNWRGTDFSLCDDITSGMMQGYCADHFENFAKVKRNRKLMDIQVTWSVAEKAEYVLLRKAADRYINAHVENEVNQDGTARVAMAIEAQASLEEELLHLLQDLNHGKLPSYTMEQFKAIDSNLNTIYSKVQKVKDPFWGSVSKEGIRDTQREWIRYRDVWVRFCKKKYHNVGSNSLKTYLTAIRIDILKQFDD